MPTRGLIKMNVNHSRGPEDCTPAKDLYSQSVLTVNVERPSHHVRTNRQVA